MNLSLEFSKFNLYPFPVLAMDGEGFVVYKNSAVSKLYKNVRIGAKMSNYTGTNFCQGLNSQTFYGEDCLLFVSSDNGITLVFVILPFKSDTFETLLDVTKINGDIEKSIFEYDCSLDEKSQKIYLKNYLNNLEKAKKFGEFAINFANNNLTCESTNVHVALQEIVDVVANRLSENIKIELCSETKRTNLNTDRKNFLITVLSTLYFCVANTQSDKIKISLFEKDADLHIAFEIVNGCNFNKLFENNSDFSKNPYTFILSSSLEFARVSNVELELHTEPFKNTFRHTFDYVLKNSTLPELSMSQNAVFTQNTKTFINALESIFSK